MPTLRRLDEFVVGQSNRLAYSTACRLIESADGPTVSPLFIHGECGLGKTHLLQGICRRSADLSGRPGHVRYVTGEQFTNEYIASIRNDTVDEFRKTIRRLDLLAIDDVHFLSNKVRTQGEFLHTLDAIDLTGARVVLASDEHPRLIKKFSQALISRFLSGMVVQIDRPDRPTRIAIVRRLARARHLPIKDGAVEAIASRCVGSVRELEGAVTKLAALWALQHDMAPTGDDASAPASAARRNGAARKAAKSGAAGPGEVGLVLVEQLFKDHGWKPPTPVRIATVIDVICRRLGIGRADLMGSSRHRRVVLGRGLVAALGRELTTHSYPEIARAMGRSFHSTIHTAEQRLRRQVDENHMATLDEAQAPMPLRELVDQLRHEITRVTASSSAS
jgi:chromosomal replication initiator protein